ncbi:hypothetical protein QY95_04024 [Bacillus thermotolerans]|uniref:Uncharacterized protein n=1 Tax=Bacillus thermotolerans TaxID=1221996 RepID=A0A0F5HLK9_BACTR|nr:hypothetical protein QY95_04024 [Bacillus thermotolerans]
MLFLIPNFKKENNVALKKETKQERRREREVKVCVLNGSIILFV